MSTDAELVRLVVIGSSAGGIEALSALVATLPADFPAPIVIAQHVAPDRVSHLREILSRRTVLPVLTVGSRNPGQHEPLKPGTIYVVPADRHVEISDHDIRLLEGRTESPSPSIDLLFSSAAAVYGEGLLAVVLTGSGSDGAAGARAVKERGGTVIIQDPKTASYPSMPLSLDPPTVDIVVSLDTMGPLLYDLATGVNFAAKPDDQQQLQKLLEQLRDRSGVDFTSYKSPTITRRLQRRMVATGKETLPDYVRYLQRHPEEYQRLVSSFLIKVTEFFRDPRLFDYLREHVLPDIVERARGHGNEIRLWSAGCATGEEAYSIAILLREVLGDELGQFNVRVFATDLDADAIAYARRGIYPASALSLLAPDLIARYFTAVESEFEIKKSVRSLVIFGQHDLGQRAPFPRIDLTLCRNVLIYFTPELQKRALQLFAFSIRPSGYLVLGKAETDSLSDDCFKLEQAHLKVYRRQSNRSTIPPGLNRESAPALAARVDLLRRSFGVEPRQHLSPLPPTVAESLESFLVALPMGAVIVNSKYDVLSINSVARSLLGIHGPALGEDLIHLAREVPPELLRDAVDVALRGQETDVIVEIPSSDIASGLSRYTAIRCRPLEAGPMEDPNSAAVVLADDVTRTELRHRKDIETIRDLREETARLRAVAERLSTTNRELQEANLGLAATNAELRNTNEQVLLANEEVLLANEEVQAALEEVETLNEELQASNEEFQATVEELNTTNDDLEARTRELQQLATAAEMQQRAAEFERERLRAILSSLDEALVLVQEDGQIQLTNGAYDRTFGADQPPTVTDTEGKPLPDEQQPLARVARGEVFHLEFARTGADGAKSQFEVTGQPLSGESGGVLAIRDITDSSTVRLQDEFLAMASHELRTPLTVVLGSLQRLQRLLGPEAAKPLTEGLAMGLGQARRLVRLVDDLTDVARLQSGKLTLSTRRLDLREVLRRAVAAVASVGEGPEARLEIDSGPLWVEADADRLEQVFSNLLINAATHAASADGIEVVARRSDQTIEVQVRDHGPGIPEAELREIFSRFNQGSRSTRKGQNGFGLGLFIAREIVIAHGGTIEAQSKLNKGTTFTVRLPAIG